MITTQQEYQYRWYIVNNLDINEYLPGRLSRILKWRYKEGKSRRETGALEGVSSSRIAQLEEKAFRIFRHPKRCNRKVEAMAWEYAKEKGLDPKVEVP